MVRARYVLISVSIEYIEVSVELCQLSHSSDFISHLIMWEIELSIFLYESPYIRVPCGGFWTSDHRELKMFHAPEDLAV